MLYSVGYEGRTIEQFCELLSLASVQTLIDVRLTPLSRKPGFSKRRLSDALDEVGIGYQHERDLGNPPDNRAPFRTSDPSPGRARYRDKLSNGAGPALHSLIAAARERDVAILCVEADPFHCHRQVITDRAADLAPDLLTIEL